MTNPIHWDDQGQPLSTLFDDIYFSKHNGLEETEYVFLQHNALQERFDNIGKGGTFVIAETGFGTGLNFLATYRLWALSKRHPSSALHFVSVEKYPLAPSTLEKALSLWPELKPYSDTLLAVYPRSTINGFHHLVISDTVSLTLIFDDAVNGLQQLYASSHPLFQRPQWGGIDAWFLDGFAPSKNPSMWSDDLFTSMALLSKKNTTLATFTAAGIARRKLVTAGFDIQKVSGYGSKREMIKGSYHTNEEQDKHIAHPRKKKYDNAPWMLRHSITNTPLNKNIAIIGGGLAGCHTAYSLAKKGYTVTIFEKGGTLAQAASGNAQGVVYAKLAATEETLGEFNTHCLLYAQQFYTPYWRQGTKDQSIAWGQQCGVLQLGLTEKSRSIQQKIIERLSDHPSDIRHLSAKEASKIANTNIHHPALFFPRSGWINPVTLCQWLIQHPRINVVTHTKVTQLQAAQAQPNGTTSWTLHTLNKQNISAKHHTHTAIIANAFDALHFEQTAHLPLKSIRGQVSHIPCTQKSRSLATVVCGKGYIAPAEHFHCVGASFDLHSTSHELTQKEHQSNINNLHEQTPRLLDTIPLSEISQDDASDTLRGRVGFRCVTPDYMPIIGPVPIEAAIQQDYSPLQRNAYEQINTAGQHHPHLYVNIGYGSRGLAYSPLCSELLTSLIKGTPPPLPQTLANKLHPARFIIRDIIRS